MMSCAEGKIFALHRKDKHKTLGDVTAHSYVTIFTSKLSEFETGKCVLNKEILISLYRALDMEYRQNDKDIEAFKEAFYRFYEDILLYRDCSFSYQKVCEKKDSILTTVVYPQFLLAQLVYAAFQHDTLFDYNSTVQKIEKCFSLLDDMQKQIYYDTLGIHYQSLEVNKIDKALSCFDKASVYGCEKVTGMMLYHKTVSLTLINRFSDAMECAQQARRYFVNQLNLNRIVLCSGIIANIYRRVGTYDKAIAIYRECILHMDKQNLVSDLKMAYNNLTWTYLLAGKYSEAIVSAQSILDKWGNHVPSYFYLSFIYEKLGDYQKAKDMIQKARDYKHEYNPSDYMKAMVEAFYTYLSAQKSVQTKMRKLNIALKEAIKTNNLESQIFVLKIIVNLLYDNNKSEELICYQAMLIECYEKRR